MTIEKYSRLNYGTHYFKHKENDTKLMFNSVISNGVLLTEFDEGTGASKRKPIIYMTFEEFGNNWEKFNFNLPLNEELKPIITEFCKSTLDTMKNYGIEENHTQDFSEFFGTMDGCSIFHDWLKEVEHCTKMGEKPNAVKFIEGYYENLDEDFRYEISDDSLSTVFPFIVALSELVVVAINSRGNKE